VARNISTPAPAPVNVGYPINFQQVGAGTDLGNGDLFFSYTWQSSTGRLADLSSCLVGENVTYNNGVGATFCLPSPSMPSGDCVGNPFISNVNGSVGGFGDHQHLYPSTTFVKPYISQSVPSVQYFRYICGNQSQYTTISGPHNVLRTVHQNLDLSWYFLVTKDGSSATVNPLP
jgi:hypothetical protein